MKTNIVWLQFHLPQTIETIELLLSKLGFNFHAYRDSDNSAIIEPEKISDSEALLLVKKDTDLMRIIKTAVNYQYAPVFVDQTHVEHSLFNKSFTFRQAAVK